MLIVVALGGNALLQRGQPMTADMQRGNIRIAAQALAPVAKQHQVGDLARQRPAGGADRFAAGGLQAGRALSVRCAGRADAKA